MTTTELSVKTLQWPTVGSHSGVARIVARRAKAGNWVIGYSRRTSGPGHGLRYLDSEGRGRVQQLLDD